jgi:hypothetical protein
MNFKITFKLLGRGVYYDAYEPIMLDSLVAYSLLPMRIAQRRLTRDAIPEEFELPLLKNNCGVHHASALFPAEVYPEALRFWRKRFRVTATRGMTKGSPNLTNAIYREHNVPVPLLLATEMYAYGSGNKKAVLSLLKRNVQYLGKKRSYGFGRISDICAEEIEEDCSLVKDGVAMRWLPEKNGYRRVRLTPPYWNIHNAVPCCEIGDECLVSVLRIKG